jgi:hypothetical protein
VLEKIVGLIAIFIQHWNCDQRRFLEVTYLSTQHVHGDVADNRSDGCLDVVSYWVRLAISRRVAVALVSALLW